ncbi:hypothetical protein [Jidongwangia harbinensis]|uniref:hypothetical protein n=1 Tax=Jidongwangia harbinensis TaxID=2878561 RepID=UPI001CD9D41B|nr:hypothetical protein [Jidongwangia harbinensis]MCA2215250.1 hypothetical protein [Jidongwangia harbinensis]
MSTHISAGQLARYATGTAGPDDADVWGVEIHLESCPDCRAGLAGRLDPGTAALVDRVGGGLAGALGPAPARRRMPARLHRWLAWTLLPRLAVVIGALTAALTLELLMPEFPSPVLLVAPVAPLAGVAAVWSRRTDPAWELITAAPQSGLLLLLRRTVAVLATLVPVLAVAGGIAGASPALWLLPCLATTAATLALGSRLGVPRAAAVVTGTWIAAVAAPAVLTERLPVVLGAGSWPGWAAATVALAALVWFRAGDFHRLASRY